MLIAWISSRPTPGQAKIVSVMIVPVSTAPNCRPMIVTTGIRLLRKAWRTTARVCDSPRARAASTYSSRSSSITDDARHAREDRGERRAERDRRQHEVRAACRIPTPAASRA